MKLSDVLIKPILSEKANNQQEKLRRYAFRVDKKANKLEIKKAVENFYGVTVVDVNTVVAPAKSKTRYTKAGFISGQKPSYKKAFVTIAKRRPVRIIFYCFYSSLCLLFISFKVNDPVFLFMSATDITHRQVT